MQNNHNISIQTVAEVAPIQILPGKVLANIYRYIILKRNHFINNLHYILFKLSR
jgi:hypothetical protein